MGSPVMTFSIPILAHGHAASYLSNLRELTTFQVSRQRRPGYVFLLTTRPVAAMQLNNIFPISV